jgi:hypothetical protein
MLEQVAIALIAVLCEYGQPVGNWTDYVVSLNYDLGPIRDTMRLTTDHGVVWIYEWESNVIFVTNPDDQHGYCARKPDG